MCLILILPCACKQIQNIADVKNGNVDNTYQIINIKEEKMVYIIYAQKNDSIFKIISEKTSPINACKEVKIGGLYMLDINEIFPLDSLLGNNLMPNLGIKALMLKDGSSVFIEESSHFKLYKSDDLNGLCYMKEDYNKK